MDKKFLLKFLDKIIGASLLYLLPESEKGEGIDSKRIKKILIIRPGGLGDLILLIPAIKALKTILPQAEIHLLCEKRNAALIEFINEIKEVYLYDRAFDLLKCLNNQYDVVIDTEQWYTLTAITAFLTEANIRIGFDTNRRGKLFTHPVPYDLEKYEVFSFLHLVEVFQKSLPDFENGKGFINVPANFPPLLSFLPEDKKDKIITISPGAASKEKLWELERFGKVATHFAKYGYKIALVGSKNEISLAYKIKSYEKSCIDLTGKTSLKDIALILKVSRLFLSSDSGLMHLAYAVGTPTVSLFGPTSTRKWAPRGEKNIAITKTVECGPCSTFGNIKRCQRKIKCMTLICTEEVIERMEELLKVRTVASSGDTLPGVV